MPNDPNLPGMIGPSPSERGLAAIPADPADHAEDFSRRYADDLEIATGQVMIDLNLTREEMGTRRMSRNLEHHVCFPRERKCGSFNHLGGITVISDVMNPAAMEKPYGETCGKLWRKSKLRPRIEAVIAHEKAEHENGNDHELALFAAQKTEQPIRHAARELLRAQEKGYQEK